METICGRDIIKRAQRVKYAKGNNTYYAIKDKYFFKIWTWNKITKSDNSPAHAFITKVSFWEEIRKISDLVMIPDLICFYKNFNTGAIKGTLYVFRKQAGFKHIEYFKPEELVSLGKFLEIVESFGYVYYDFAWDKYFANFARKKGKIIIFDIDSCVPIGTDKNVFNTFYFNGAFLHAYNRFFNGDSNDLSGRARSIYIQIIMTHIYYYLNRKRINFLTAQKLINDQIKQQNVQIIYNCKNKMINLGQFLQTMLNKGNYESIYKAIENSFINCGFLNRKRLFFRLFNS